MGFTLRNSALNFNIVTMSLLVRIPAATIAAAETKYGALDSVTGYWLGVVPFLTWGEQTTGTSTSVGSVLLGNSGPGCGELDLFGTQVVDEGEFPQGPGYIGLRCDPGADGPVIEVHIPAGIPASCTNTTVVTSDVIIEPSPVCTQEYIDSDASDARDEARDDWFGANSDTIVEADTVYHILISWDLSGGSATQGDGAPTECITAYSMMWMAVNDVNKTGDDLPMVWPGGDFDVNGHVSDVTGTYAGVADRSTGPVSVTLAVGTVPTNPLCIPGPAEIDVTGGGTDEPVLNIQVSDFQIFTGIALDTSVEANRRAFITSGGDPVSPSVAATLMGKDPEVYFRTFNDWQNGINRGTAGNFTPTGTIDEFTLP